MADTEPISVPANMQRGLLALLAQGGSPPSIDVIGDALWENDPPRRLRRLLGEEAISFGPSRYRMEISPVDSQAFADLAAEVAEADRAAELARACGHLPLALRIAAASLADRPHQSIGDFTKTVLGNDRLAGLEVDGDPQSAVRAVFTLSLRDLDTESAILFRPTWPRQWAEPGPRQSDAGPAFAQACPVQLCPMWRHRTTFRA